MIRCKLISPTNLMLEHPMLSPIDEAEFLVMGAKAYAKQVKKTAIDAFYLGVVVGATGCAGFAALMIWLMK
jgi:hypothetical protein